MSGPPVIDDELAEDEPRQSPKPAVAAKLAERYGTRRSRARLVTAVTFGTLAAIGAGWYLVAIAQGVARDVDVDDRAFVVIDDTTVEVEFQVMSTSPEPVICTLEALDEGFGIVGWRTIQLPPSEGILNRYVERIPTVAEATTGIVRSCHT